MEIACLLAGLGLGYWLRILHGKAAQESVARLQEFYLSQLTDWQLERADLLDRILAKNATQYIGIKNRDKPKDEPISEENAKANPYSEMFEFGVYE